MRKSVAMKVLPREAASGLSASEVDVEAGGQPARIASRLEAGTPRPRKSSPCLPEFYDRRRRRFKHLGNRPAITRELNRFQIVPWVAGALSDLQQLHRS